MNKNMKRNRLGIEYKKVNKFIKGLDFISEFNFDDKVNAINKIKLKLHELSPFNNEPVDFVRWKKIECIYANDYNPNAVAPPEMKLLERSIDADGYTQPIVTWENNGYEVVDGFHRHRIGKESVVVNERINGYLPIVVIKDDRTGRSDRIASTIRHNRARGKHKIDSMSEIVVELKRRNWSPKKIGKELGMDQDEVLRLVQITGLSEMFADKSFSVAWEAGISDETEIEVDYEMLD